ncbi:MAG: spherulation-specific family 4 protein [Tepidisphaeraceae bacterium]
MRALLHFILSIAPPVVMCSAAHGMDLLVPAYFQATGASNPWTQLTTAASRVPITAILNPNSGPGTGVDSNYVTAIANLHATGGQVIGYVSTVYGTRPIAQVKADVDAYRALYDIDGIFFDEMSNASNSQAVSYYAQLYSYVRTPGSRLRVVGNPGTNTVEGYFSTATANNIVIFESNTGFDTWTPASFVGNYPGWRSSILTYEVPAATLPSYVSLAASRGVGSLYVTDDTAIDQNPWDTLPSYWNSLVTATRGVSSIWNRTGSGMWNDGASWTNGTVPNGVNADVSLMGSITAPRSVIVESPTTVGRLRFISGQRYVVAGAGTLTMQSSKGRAELGVQLGSHVLNVPLTLQSELNIELAAGTALSIRDPVTSNGKAIYKLGPGTLKFESTMSEGSLIVGAGLVEFSSPQTFDALSIKAGNVRLGAPTLTATTLDVVDGASIDLGTGVLHTSTSLDAVRAMVVSQQVVSSGTDASHALAVVSNDSTTRIQLALRGDVDLNGTVNFTDLLAIAAHFGQPGNWIAGDNTLDGFVRGDDLVGVARNITGPIDLNALQAAGGDAFVSAWLAAASVPEPSTLLVLGLIVPGRRRSRAT